MSTSSTPALAVVGCVNMGKSSIVATLVEDDSILIAPDPGSTTKCAAYDLRLGDDAVFTLIDTPGFQNARRALDHIETWRQQHPEAGPRTAVKAFHEQFRDNPSFRHEVELLRPVLDGAGVLYVVDGTKPYLPRYEAEMRILSLTGAPRMGVVNLHGDGSPYVDAWEEALRPYFKAVRFDAHGAGPLARLDLLASLRGVDDAWAPVVDAAILRLERERAARSDQAATAIAHLLIEALAFCEEAPAALDRPRQVEQLSERLFQRMRKREQGARREVEAIYKHEHLNRTEAELEWLDKDLLDQDQWRLLGLSQFQLAQAGAAAGGLAGGVLDASVGGASFMLGTALGAAAGGGLAMWTGRRLAQVRVLGTPLGGRILRVEPPKGQKFPFVLLDRALLHWHHVARRAHARRDRLDLSSGSGFVAKLPADHRNQLARYFARIRKERGQLDEQDRTGLVEAIATIGLESERGAR